MDEKSIKLLNKQSTKIKNFCDNMYYQEGYLIQTNIFKVCSNYFRTLLNLRKKFNCMKVIFVMVQQFLHKIMVYFLQRSTEIYVAYTFFSEFFFCILATISK